MRREHDDGHGQAKRHAAKTAKRWHACADGNASEATSETDAPWQGNTSQDKQPADAELTGSD
jgi:hypothetical protein